MAHTIVKSKSFVIGVSGGTGSGKTTMVQAIVNSLKENDIITIQHDSYNKDRRHLSPEKMKILNYDHPDAIDTKLLVKHLKKLIAGKEVKIPIYDFATHTRKKGRFHRKNCFYGLVSIYLQDL